MELIIKTNESILHLGGKRIPAIRNTFNGLYEAFCDLADLENETGDAFPEELTLIISPQDKHSYQPFDEAIIVTSAEPNLPICLEYTISWEGDDLKAMRRELLQQAILNHRKFVDQWMRHFDSVAGGPCGLYLNRVIPADFNLHRAIMEDLQYAKKLLGIK